MPAWLLALFAAALLAAAAIYWLVVLTEGAYLGPRAVTALYDRAAGRYDQIKQFVDEDEDFFLGRPVARFLAGLPGGEMGRLPWLLDVASGTGRLPGTVLRASAGGCRVVALDSSAAMLAAARRKLEQRGWFEGVFVVHDAAGLPFADGQFPVVACLEALEFLPSPAGAVAELVRVAQPGGLLVLSSRIGRDARLMPGRIFSRAELAGLLRSHGCPAVEIMPWQLDYDLVFARKEGQPAADRAADWSDMLQCPRCGARPALAGEQDRLNCPRCAWRLDLSAGLWR